MSKQVSNYVLIVEDDYFLRNLLLHKVEQEKIPFDSAVNGNEALEKIKSNAPKVVILDLVLPDTDGFEVLETIRKQPETKNIPVIVVSNLGQKDEIERCLKLGANDYLIKANFTPKEIVDKIREYL